MFLTGFLTVSQMSFWGNYLPRVYPTHLRGTGEGFAANIGGACSGNGLRVPRRATVERDAGAVTGTTKLAYACAIAVTIAYGLGTILSWWLPEP